MRIPSIGQFSSLVSAGFGAFTASWVAVGFANTGDAFPQGLAIPLLPLLAIAPPVAVWAAHKFDSAPVRILAWTLALAGLAFWVAVPDGWWAFGPMVAEAT